MFSSVVATAFNSLAQNHACKPAMSNQNGSLSQNICHYLNQSRINE